MNPCKLQLPAFTALGTTPAAGWIAVSERIYRLNRVGRDDPCSLTRGPQPRPVGWLDWLKPFEPVATIGKTIRLYHIAEQDLSASRMGASRRDARP